MPLKIKQVMLLHGLKQADWARNVVQMNGKALSPTACCQISNYGIWPNATPRHSIIEQTLVWLRSKKVPEAQVLAAFELEETDDDKPIRGNPHQSFEKHVAPLERQAEKAAPEPFHIEPAMLTPVAKKHFGIFRDPFQDDVQGPEDLYLSADQRYVREALYMAAKQGGWMIAVVGESGSGKTTLRRETIDRINRESLPVVTIQPKTFDKSTLTARHICEAILADLNPMTQPKLSLEGLARQVEKALLDSSRAGQTHLLMIEEAHDLAIPTLKYLKRFWEMEDGFKKLLSIALIGQPELRDKLDERRFPAAREVIRRIEIVDLLPLDGGTGDYLALKFKRIGKDMADIVDSSAIDAIRQRLTIVGRSTQRQVISMNYPLTVNNLVTRALNLAAELGAPKISADIVKEC